MTSLQANFEQQILFDRDAPNLLEQIDRVFQTEGLSDHGMLDYILDMWHQLNVCYRARLEFLASLVCSQELLTSKGLYARLHSESSDLADFWAGT